MTSRENEISCEGNPEAELRQLKATQIRDDRDHHTTSYRRRCAAASEAEQQFDSSNIALNNASLNQSVEL